MAQQRARRGIHNSENTKSEEIIKILQQETSDNGQNKSFDRICSRASKIIEPYVF